MSTEIKVTAALDVGTAQSGYAYMFTNSPDKVLTSSFHGNQKTPSSLLLDKKNRLVAYGQEAEDMYKSVAVKGDNSTTLFRNFKMALHHNSTLTKKTTVLDISRQHNIPIYDLLVMSIRYLKNHFIRWINKSDFTYNEDDVFFVLLVPAIFDDRSKWLYREAALKAGISTNRLILALEAETSSLWCQHVNINGVNQKETRYIVCDIGGGTVDIAVHESSGDGSVDSVHYPCGGDWAGIQVTTCFKAYLTLLFGAQSIENFIQKHPVEWLKMLEKFEKSKNTETKVGQKDLSIDIPDSLLKPVLSDKGLTNVSELADIIKPPNFGGHFKLVNNKIKIDEEASKGLFTYTMNCTVGALDKLYQKGVVIGESINHVIFVGGVVNNKTFQEMLKNCLNRFNTVFVQDSNMFAVNGAVLYGHKRSLMRTRVTSLTYGIRSTVPYNENKHKDGGTRILNGVKMSTDNFHVLVKAGTVLNSGHEVIEIDKPLTGDDKEQVFEIYSCGLSDEMPSLVTHYSVQKEATFTVPLPFGCLVDDKVFERCVILGEPELSFKITFKKGKKENFIRAMTY
ncbi:hypothetical protein ACF0H5_010249 [Mactra antiquata]